eukprot:SAG31_NODE_14715_length_791_cov_1.040462_1_plen_253_part_01
MMDGRTKQEKSIEPSVAGEAAVLPAFESDRAHKHGHGNAGMDEDAALQAAVAASAAEQREAGCDGAATPSVAVIEGGADAPAGLTTGPRTTFDGTFARPQLQRQIRRQKVRHVHADSCQWQLSDGVKVVGAVVAFLAAYLVAAAIIIFCAGLVARIMASTDLNGWWLSFVSCLLCMLIFVGMGGCSVAVLRLLTGQWWRDADHCMVMVPPGCLCLGLVSSILCIILSHPMNKLNHLEEAPLMEGLSPLGINIS